MRLFDRTTGELREVEVRPRMGIYVCGITPYDSAHLGHAFTYTHFDVLVRYLRHLGSDVVHVQNVTDVDDDILRVSRERGVDFRELAASETALFEGQMRAIGIAPATHNPRATEYVPQMVEEIQRILHAGHGYARQGNVYFSVASDPEYGRLSLLDRPRMLELVAERGGNPEDPNKDDPLDFVLWQRSAPGEPSWDSPWSPGRPGWHIECSTMARRLIGQPVDIHGGGSDLIYPHHESEIAQAECLRGERPFARRWMHTGEVRQEGEKMSKSLGNMTFVTDMLQRWSPGSIRRYLLGKHYGSAWEYSEHDFERTLRAPLDDASAGGREAFFAAMDEDLDTPRALRVLDRATAEGQDWVEEGAEVLGLRGI